MPLSVESIVNQALVEIGYPGRIVDLYDGSPAAVAAIEIYSQTRDEIFDAGDWPLARRANIPLTLLKGPPPPGGYTPDMLWNAQYPPPGWLYAYAYPADMIELKAILPAPGAMFDLDPQPCVWRVDNDNSLIDRDGNSTGQTKVILTNAPNALAVYIGQVLDPNLWEPGFISTLIRRLGEKLARALLHDEAVMRDIAAQEQATMAVAERARG